MKIVFTNPPNSEPIPVRRPQKSSTTELKQALEKIKQTQMQVLKVLRSQAETSNMSQIQLKQMSQNIEANLPYIKSITNVNLLKIAEINKMRRQMENQRERAHEKISILDQRNKILEQELEAKHQHELLWANERKKLIEKNNALSQENTRLSQHKSGDNSNLQHELNEKIRAQQHLEAEVGNLQQHIRDLTQERENFRRTYEETRQQIITLERKANQQSGLNRSQSKDRLNLPYEALILEIKKISSNHEKIYSNLKTRTRVTISDLDTQQEIQQSFSKLLSLLQTSQKRSTADSESAGNKLPDSYSFGDEVKNLQKNMAQSQVMRRSIADLRIENVQLKQDKQSVRNYATTLQIKIKELESQMHLKSQKNNLFELKEYTNIIEELKKQMERIRHEKQDLSSLVRKLGETSIKSAPEEGGLKILREQLDEIIGMNNELRKQNDGLKSMIDGFKLQIESIRLGERKFQEKIMQKQSIVEKQIHEKDYLVQQLKKYTKAMQQKDIAVLKLQAKVADLQKVADANMHSYEHEVKLKIDETGNLRQQITQQLKEIAQLRDISYKYQNIVNENDLVKKNIMHLNSSIIHLWEVKEAEYANIYAILGRHK